MSKRTKRIAILTLADIMSNPSATPEQVEDARELLESIIKKFI